MSRPKLKTTTAADGKTYIEAPAGIDPPDYGGPTASLRHVLRLRRAVCAAWDHKALSPSDALYLLLLTERAQADDGALRTRELSPRAWYTSTQLARVLKISRPTFRARWHRWEAEGWATSSQPSNPAWPLERRLCIPIAWRGAVE